MLEPTYDIPPLPPDVELETPSALKAAASAHRHLAELKGRVIAVPTPEILIDALTLQEARASCEIENIVTTQDELYRSALFPNAPWNSAVKEVTSYRSAIKLGFDQLKQSEQRLTNELLIAIYRIVKSREDGYRVRPGTVISNTFTGEVVHVPPQDPGVIRELMNKLTAFVNDDTQSGLDPLIRMAVIHHQFESIHPFEDGNGRVGRILNVLYLVRCGLLETPILYLSRAITRSKPHYYRLLRTVQHEGTWEDWVVYMLKAVAETSRDTLELVEAMRSLMTEFEKDIRRKLPRIYSHELLNALFRHPYTRIATIQRDLQVSRPTAAKYLMLLTAEGFLSKRRAGRADYYVNTRLVDLFRDDDDGALR